MRFVLINAAFLEMWEIYKSVRVKDNERVTFKPEHGLRRRFFVVKQFFIRIMYYEIKY